MLSIAGGLLALFVAVIVATERHKRGGGEPR
jgi:hypothetical protein